MEVESQVKLLLKEELLEESQVEFLKETYVKLLKVSQNC